MEIILQILLIIMIITLIVIQIIMFVDHRKSIKLTDEVSRRLLKEIELTIKKHQREIKQLAKKHCKKNCKDDTEVL